jgi:hypothetical protein
LLSELISLMENFASSRAKQHQSRTADGDVHRPRTRLSAGINDHPVPLFAKPNVPRRDASRVGRCGAEARDWTGQVVAELSDTPVYAATFTATGTRLRNPTSSANRPLLHLRQPAYNTLRL